VHLTWRKDSAGHQAQASNARMRWALVAALILAAVLLVWAHHRFLTSAGRYADRDFMALWCGGRALLEGLDPYDTAVWIPLRQRYGSTWMPAPQMPLPLWTCVLLVPFALLSLDWAAAAWLVFSELLFGLCIFLLLAHWGARSPSIREFGLVTLSAFASRWVLTVLNNGQLTAVLLAVLVLSLLLIRRGKPFAAGLVLALLALKPSPFFLFVPCLGLWLLYRAKWRIVAGEAAGLALLLAGGWLLQPGWLLEWLQIRSQTQTVFKTPTVWGIAYQLSPLWWPAIGLLLAVGLTFVFGWVVFTNRRLEEMHVVSLALSGSLLITPYVWAYDHALLLVPLLLLAASRHPHRWWLGALLIWGVPWLAYGIAAQIDLDAVSAVVPAAAGVAFYVLACPARQAGEELAL
jgi:hypothetical protein